jgi:chemotaxis protein histidine kinase CheA
VAEGPPSMLSQLHDIANRYLQRTLRETDELQEFVEKSLAGELPAIKQTERLAHKIHGSGAMFGFHEVSECAGRIERLVCEHPSDLDVVGEELTALVVQLSSAVRHAATERGVDG